MVARPFNQVQARCGRVGRKDYQQLAVIRYLVRDLAFPVENCCRCDTLREARGLAMKRAQTSTCRGQRGNRADHPSRLHTIAMAVRAGAPRTTGGGGGRTATLREAGFAPDYAVVVRPDFSEPADGEDGAQVALIAARLGRTRLIDN